jgi:hypothetical protein
MYNFSILRDLKKMLLCCNKRGNHAISQNWRYFRLRKVLFYTLLNQCNTTDKHNHTHTKKRYLAVISHSTRFKEFNRKKTKKFESTVVRLKRSYENTGSVVCLTMKGRQLEQNFEELKPASHVSILGTI